jgi:predicted DCC family thiol-disulfide oxidoreductase YuxK
MAIANLLEEPPLEPTLLIDSHRCRYCSELVKELRRTDLNETVSVVDIGSLSVDDIQCLQWLPGVPTLVHDDKVYMGVDAFSRCRDLVRSSVLLNKACSADKHSIS